MKKLFIANWKMKLNMRESRELAQKYPSFFQRSGMVGRVDVAVAPTSVYFQDVRASLNNFIPLCGQDVSAFEKGAYTGEISATSLSEFGCRFCLVGHSERRMNVNETDSLIHKKISQCAKNKIIPVLCVGETEAERKKGDTDGVILKQIHGALEKQECFPQSELVIAYEPVWAIGSGNAVKPEDLQSTARLIKRAVSGLFSEKFFDEKVRIIYGGSADAANAASFLAVPHINGLLVGTASLNPKEFFEIIALAK